MSPFVDWLPAEIARSTLWLALAGVTAALLLKLARITSPALHRIAWCMTLLVGCFLVRLPIDVPWYPAEPAPMPAVEPAPPRSDVYAADSEMATLPPITPEAMPIESGPPIVAAPPASSPARPSAVQSARWVPSWPQLALMAWMVGIAALVALWLVGYCWFVFRLPPGIEGDPTWQDEWRTLLAGQGTGRPTALRVTGNLGPMLCRLPRGYELLVPEPLWRKLSAAEREAILRHELAHWRRGDVWKSLAVRVLALVHWFNPLSWWAVRRFDEAAEWACDRAATAGEPTAYAKILVHLSELAGPRARYGSALRGRPLAARIRRLVTKEQKEDSAMKKTFVFAAAACLAFAALVRVQLVAQEPAGPAEVKPAAQPASPRVQSQREPVVGPVEEPVPAPPAPENPKSENLWFFVGAEPDSAVHRAQQRMVETAKQAYGAAVASWKAATITPDRVYIWSSRWMVAALDAARKHEDRIAAATAHLDRMRDFEKSIKVLYESGTKGGEALEMASANFYVAEAERKLAELNAPPHVAPRAAVQPTIPVAPRASIPPQATPQQPVPQATPAPVIPPQTAPPALRPSPPTSPYPRNLRYDEKTFDEWTTLLHRDLSPVLRRDAMYALAEFAANGYGREATETIFATMQAYAPSSTDRRERELSEAAIFAVGKAPLDDVLPIVTKALKSGNGNQRLFAVNVLPVSKAKDEIVPLLVSAMQDKDPAVADLARMRLAVMDHDAPALADWLRAALSGQNSQDLSKALSLLDRPELFFPNGEHVTHIARFPALAPEVVNLLGHDEPGIRRQAAHCLWNLGQAAVPALEAETSKSATAPTSTRARQLLDQMLQPAGAPRREFNWESE
ncbi:MAG: M56 family metallopeptidase [Pirellulales bacterium]